MSLYRHVWWPRRSELGKDGGLDVLYMSLYRHVWWPRRSALGKDGGSLHESL